MGIKVVCTTFGNKERALEIVESGEKDGVFQELENEIAEIKAWDIAKNPNILSDKHRKEINDKFMKRNSDYAMRAREMLKNPKIEDSVRGEDN